MLLNEEQDAEGCDGAGDNECKSHRRGHCNEMRARVLMQSVGTGREKMKQDRI